MHTDVISDARVAVLQTPVVWFMALAAAWLNHHIPWGFHGTFTRRVAERARAADA